MAAKKPPPTVRIATEDDSPVPERQLSLSEAFEAGDELAQLVAKRRILIAHIESEKTLARDLAVLTRRDDELLRQIEAVRALRLQGGGVGHQSASRLDAGDEEFNPHTA